MTSKPDWTWLALAAAGLYYAVRTGKLGPTNLPAPAPPANPSPPTSPGGLLTGLEGSRTKLSALALGVLAANEVWKFIPEQYVQGALYLASASGLYFLRDALDRLQRRLPASPTPGPNTSAPDVIPMVRT